MGFPTKMQWFWQQTKIHKTRFLNFTHGSLSTAVLVIADCSELVPITQVASGLRRKYGTPKSFHWAFPAASPSGSDTNQGTNQGTNHWQRQNKPGLPPVSPSARPLTLSRSGLSLGQTRVNPFPRRVGDFFLYYSIFLAF